MKKLYRIIIDVQSDIDGMMSICDELMQGKDNIGTPFSDWNGEAVIDYLAQYDDGVGLVDDFQETEPYWANNGTDYAYTKDGYTLLYNTTLGGVYMLYREADSMEREYYYDSGK